jgi:hypothetical protein
MLGMLPSALILEYGRLNLHLSHMNMLKLLLPIVSRKRGIIHPLSRVHADIGRDHNW